MDEPPNTALAKPSWNERYGEKHRWRRYGDWPRGFEPPSKVRLYERAGHYLLNWWDPTAKKSLSERIDGDLLTALGRARQIDDRIANFRSAGPLAKAKLGHGDLVSLYLADLNRRVEARLISAATWDRYRAALDHYLAWCRTAVAERKYSHTASVNREFRLEFCAYLANRTVSGNGRKEQRRPMKSQAMVMDVTRALYEWAADPERGNLMPEGFRNPFLRGGESRPLFVGDPLAAPKITMGRAAEFLAAATADEKRLFAPMVLFGLRAAEPCFLFREHVGDDWLEVPNLPEFDYLTKGRRHKRFPWTPELAGFRDRLIGETRRGLLYKRDDFFGRSERPAVADDLAGLAEQYRNRLAAEGTVSQRTRLGIRRNVFREAGALTYEDIQRLFERISGKLGWSERPTLKDFRHLFATTLSDANISESYRKYLLGHAPGREASVAYTHLHRLREQFATVLQNHFAPVLDVLATT